MIDTTLLDRAVRTTAENEAHVEGFHVAPITADALLRRWQQHPEIVERLLPIIIVRYRNLRQGERGLQVDPRPRLRRIFGKD